MDCVGRPGLHVGVGTYGLCDRSLGRHVVVGTYGLCDRSPGQHVAVGTYRLCDRSPGQHVLTDCVTGLQDSMYLRTV